MDAVLFDFGDATWKRIQNSNGVPSQPSPFQTSQIDFSYGEIIGGTGSVPAPSHLYQSVSFIPPRLNGGPRGSYLKLTTRFAGPTPGSSMGVHRMDLATGLWSRATNDKFSTTQYDYYAAPTAVFADIPGNPRFYLLSGDMHRLNVMKFFEPGSSSIRSTPSFPNIQDFTCATCGNPTFFFDPVRQLIVSQGGAQTGSSAPWPMRAIDLNAISQGWRALTVSGQQPGGRSDAPRWSYYPRTGHFYTHDWADGNLIWRLRAPAGDWRTGVWTFDRVTVTGAVFLVYTTTNGPSDSTRGTFMYVPAIDSLAWIAGENSQVVIMKPPM